MLEIGLSLHFFEKNSCQVNVANSHLVNTIHSLYGCGSPLSVTADASRETSSSFSGPTTFFVPPHPSTPQLIVPPSPFAPTTQRHTPNAASSPMPISQRYRPYSVTSPWTAPSPTSPGYRGFGFSGTFQSPAGPPVPPNTPVPAPSLNHQPLSLSSLRAHNPTSSTIPLVVPSSLRSNAHPAAFASRIPPSRYHLHAALWSTVKQTYAQNLTFRNKNSLKFNMNQLHFIV